VLPHFTDDQLMDTEHLARRFAVHVDLDGILAAMGEPPAR
jgi:hypothetical protein